MTLEQKVTIRGEDKASEAFRKVGAASKSLGTRVFELTTTFSSLINIGRTAAGAVAAVGKALASPIKEAIAAEQAQTKLAAKLKATGEQAGYSAGELTALAVGLQKVSIFGDDAVISAQNLLLSYSNISRNGGAFERTLQLSADLASQLGIDLDKAAEKLGKSLNEPIKGLETLREVGVSFTKAERELIVAMVNANRVADAQAMILTRLEGTYAGSAAALRDTFGGALAGLKNAWSDVLQAIGEFITKNAGVVLIVDTIVDSISAWADGLTSLGGNLDAQTAAAEVFRSILVGVLVVLEGLLVAFAQLGNIMGGLVSMVSLLGGVLGKVLFDGIEGKLSKAMSAVSGGSESAAEAIGALRLQLESLDLKAAVESSAALGAATVDVAAAGDKFAGVMKGEAAQAALLRIAINALASAKRLLVGVERQVAPEFDATRRRISELLGELAPASGAFEVWIGQWNRLREAAGGNLGEQLVTFKSFEDELRKTVELSESWRKANVGAGNAVDGIGESLEALEGPQEVAVINAEELAEAYRKAQEEWNRSIEAMADSSADAFRDIFADAFGGLRSLQEGFYSFGQMIRVQLATALLDPILGAQGPLAQLFEPVFSALKSIGAAIAQNFIQPLVTGILSFFTAKTGAETAAATASVGIQAGVVTATTAQQITAIGLMMPGLVAAATAALIASFGGAAAAAAALPGLLATGAALGTSLAASMAVPAFAEGGRVTRPTLALIGEAGPETVIPESRPNLASALLASLFDRNPGLAASAGGGRGTTVFMSNTLNLTASQSDPKSVADAIFEEIDRKIGREFRTR